MRTAISFTSPPPISVVTVSRTRQARAMSTDDIDVGEKRKIEIAANNVRLR